MQNEKLHITLPNSTPSEELYRFGADGNMRLYSYDRIFYSLYGYDRGTTRTYKYSFDLTPNWVNGQLLDVQFNPHNAMLYPNSYLNFNNDGYYTKHYYNGMERIASRLGDNNLLLATHDPELQDRKWQLDSNIRRNVVDIAEYEFLSIGEEQDPNDPKPIYELPVIGLNNLQPSADGIFYYHTNHLGSTCYVTDENASVVQGFLYAPFGEITNEYNSTFGNNVLPKYSFNAKELDEETGFYYYEARYYAPPVFISRDPLFEKYPTFSPYAYCVNNPVKYIDPDGMDVYLLFYANSDKMFEAAAETRKREIETSRGFNRKKDIVIMNEFSDIGDIESLTNDAVNRYSLMYGETVEVGIWSHAGWDGPRGEVEASGDYASGKQMTLEGWNNIDFNWNRNNANILFYGCNTGNEIYQEEWIGSFARKISKQRNFKDVNVWGQQTSAFPSFTPQIRATNVARSLGLGYNIDDTYMVGGNNNEGWQSLWFTRGKQPNALPMNVYKNGQLIRTAFQNR